MAAWPYSRQSGLPPRHDAGDLQSARLSHARRLVREQGVQPESDLRDLTSIQQPRTHRANTSRARLRAASSCRSRTTATRSSAGGYDAARQRGETVDAWATSSPKRDAGLLMNMIVAVYDLEFKMGWPRAYPRGAVLRQRLVFEGRLRFGTGRRVGRPSTMRHTR